MNSSPSKRRTEIEGLRTIAAALVMVYHVWVGRVSGGVDVFFVVTGFFITLLILRQVDAGRITPLAYFGRLFRRLMPGAAAVLVFVGLITVLFAPSTLQRRNFEEIIASALSVENLYLAFNAVDYLNAEDPSTPAQHFWAMSIQAQFYVLWLLLGAVVLLLVKLFSSKPRRTMMWVVLVVFVVSLGLSVWQTSVAQPFAYFVPWTRMWEFSIGAFVALLGSQIHLRGTAAGLASWVALIALALTGAVLPVETGFPGVIAAVPALAAAMILISTREDERWWAGTKVLSWKPFVWLGSMAFGIYLWHWPLLMLYRYWRGLEAVPGLLGGPAIVIGSIALAYLTKKLLEDPIRNGWQQSGAPRRLVAAGLVVAWIIPVGIPVGAVAVEQRMSDGSGDIVTSEACRGHSALVTGLEICAEELALRPLEPRRSEVRDDIGDAYECYTNADEQRLRECGPFGAQDGLRVAVIGNSHAAMMTPSFRHYAEERGWSMIPLVSNGCVWTLIEEGDDCEHRLLQQEQLLLEEEPFDVVIAIGSTMTHSDEYPFHVVRDRFESLMERGTTVIVIEDNPRLNNEQTVCILEASDDRLREGECDMSESEALEYTDGYWEVGRELDGVITVPTRDLFCADGVCPIVIGGIIAYRDGHHLTMTYIESIFPELMHRIDERTDVLAP